MINKMESFQLWDEVDVILQQRESLTQSSIHTHLEHLNDEQNEIKPIISENNASNNEQLLIDNQNMKQTIKNLITQNESISDDNVQLKMHNDSLQKQLIERMEQIEELNELEDEYNSVINDLENQLNVLHGSLEEKNDLNEQIELTGDNDTYRPNITDQNKTFKMSFHGGFHGYNSTMVKNLRLSNMEPVTSLGFTRSAPQTPLRSIAEQHSDRLEIENDRLHAQVIILQKQFDDNIELMKLYQVRNGNMSDIVSSCNEDEEAPLIDVNNDGHCEIDKNDNYGCVIFGCRLW